MLLFYYSRHKSGKFIGKIEKIENGKIFGWLANLDKNLASQKFLNCKIRCNNNLFANVTANITRKDLQVFGLEKNIFGFTILLNAIETKLLDFTSKTLNFSIETEKIILPKKLKIEYNLFFHELLLTTENEHKFEMVFEKYSKSNFYQKNKFLQIVKNKQSLGKQFEGEILNFLNQINEQASDPISAVIIKYSFNNYAVLEKYLNRLNKNFINKDILQIAINSLPKFNLNYYELKNILNIKLLDKKSRQQIIEKCAFNDKKIKTILLEKANNNPSKILSIWKSIKDPKLQRLIWPHFIFILINHQQWETIEFIKPKPNWYVQNESLIDFLESENFNWFKSAMLIYQFESKADINIIFKMLKSIKSQDQVLMQAPIAVVKRIIINLSKLSLNNTQLQFIFSFICHYFKVVTVQTEIIYNQNLIEILKHFLLINSKNNEIYSSEINDIIFYNYLYNVEIQHFIQKNNLQFKNLNYNSANKKAVEVIDVLINLSKEIEEEKLTIAIENLKSLKCFNRQFFNENLIALFCFCRTHNLHFYQKLIIENLQDKAATFYNYFISSTVTNSIENKALYNTDLKNIFDKTQSECLNQFIFQNYFFELESKNSKPILQKIKINIHKISEAKTLAILVSKNELNYLSNFLSHHRKIGIEHFFYIDNNSNDGSLEFMKDQPDVSVFFTNQDYSENRFGVDWQETILKNYCHNKWTLILDADELFIYHNFENENINSLIKDLEEEKANAILTPMIDFYPNKPLEESDLKNGIDFYRTNNYFDSLKSSQLLLKKSHGVFNNSDVYFKGLRNRIFGAYNLPPSPDYLNHKYCFVKYNLQMQFVEGIHFIANAKISNNTAGIMHFKYHSGFQEKVNAQLASNQHWNNSKEYNRYAYYLESNKNHNFYDVEISLEYKNSKNLVDAGYITSRF